jgi:CheY-like chemotaxis protein
MPRAVANRVLIVDDDAVFCDIASKVLEASGFRVSTAEDGFEGLSSLQAGLPDAIICDLNMPRMSGFEFLSIVRRRFPQIPVIVISGEFFEPHAADGVLADAFFEKGAHSPRITVQKLRELLAHRSPRSAPDASGPAPVWVPLHRKNYFVVTCTHCVRSFSVPVNGKILVGEKEQTAKCESCGNEVRYILDVALLGKPKEARIARVK